MTAAAWVPYREPLRATLTRNIVIALIAGAVLTQSWGGWKHWPMATVLMLWPSFGGHWVELWFLNWVRPRISPARGVQIVARIAVWFVGGALLGLGMWLTATQVAGIRAERLPAWWLGGFAFIAIELVAQMALQLRGNASFYDGRG